LSGAFFTAPSMVGLIALTAAAVVVGGVVMVTDPIFQGLAVALMNGAVLRRCSP
jgi:hypothetical protein